jgi:uncharacterized protein involved in exopolysaccharide biosynthesis
MAAVAFDTLRFVEKLEGGGFSPAQARAAAEAFADATVEPLATKSDLRELGASLRAEIVAVRADLRELGTELRAEIAIVKADLRELGTQLRAEIAAFKAEIRAEIAGLKAEQALLKWMVGFNLALTVGVLFLLLKR